MIVSHWGFHLHLPNGILSIFYVLICQLYLFFGVSVHIASFCPLKNCLLFVFLLLSFERSLGVLDVRLLSDMCFAHILILMLTTNKFEKFE